VVGDLVITWKITWVITMDWSSCRSFLLLDDGNERYQYCLCSCSTRSRYLRDLVMSDSFGSFDIVLHQCCRSLASFSRRGCGRHDESGSLQANAFSNEGVKERETTLQNAYAVADPNPDPDPDESYSALCQCRQEPGMVMAHRVPGCGCDSESAWTARGRAKIHVVVITPSSHLR
jgi:hypothetical protein